MRTFDVTVFNRWTKVEVVLQREARTASELRRRITLALARGWFVKLIVEVTA